MAGWAWACLAGPPPWQLLWPPGLLLSADHRWCSGCSPAAAAPLWRCAYLLLTSVNCPWLLGKSQPISLHQGDVTPALVTQDCWFRKTRLAHQCCCEQSTSKHQ